MTVNGRTVQGEVESRTLLVDFLRETLSLTGTHVGCDTSQCGACVVHVGGASVKSCAMLALEADGAEVMTVEGLASGGVLHPMQAAFKEHHGLQCGFCTPGMIMSGIDLLGRNADPSEAEVRLAVASFTGSFRQKPPVFSAVKIGGRRAYRLARAGETPEMPPRDVTVHEIDLVAYDWPSVDVSIHCDKGFYVRSLARDLGEALGTGGYYASIRRTAVGPFTLDVATPLDDLPEVITQSDLMTVAQATSLLESAPTD